jgi:hypothetical protein
MAFSCGKSSVLSMNKSVMAGDFYPQNVKFPGHKPLQSE